MNKHWSWLVAMAFAAGAVPLYAQESARDAGRRDLIEARVQVVVKPDPASGEYLYRYVLESALGSRQRLNAFSVVVNGNVSHVTSPRGWSALPSADGAILHWQATETEEVDSREVDTGDVPPARFAVEPGETLEGFSFRSHNSPGSVTFFAQGESKIPVLSPGQETPDFADFRRNGFSGMTSGPKPACSSGGALCLPGQRYAMKTRWRDSSGVRMLAQPMSTTEGVTSATGVFRRTPGQPESADFFVKVTKGNLFAGSFSGAEYWLEVRDMERGLTRIYHSPEDRPCAFVDSAALPFANGEAADEALEISASPEEDLALAGTEWQDDQLIQGGCLTDPMSLCLLRGRFQIDADWFDRRTGASGNGWTMVSGDSWGTFRFSDQEVVDLAVKLDVQEGSPIRFTYLPLSELEIRLKVTDRRIGTVRTYRKAAGGLCGKMSTWDLQ